MKRADWLLALGVALLALLIALFPLRPRAQAAFACLSVDGVQVARLPLGQEGEFTWACGEEFVTLRVEGEGARIAASSCPDQTCVRLDLLTRGGETAVCLPNRAVLSLEAENQIETDAILQ